MKAEVMAELRRLVRPAGGGIHLVSTGRDAQLALQERLYRVAGAGAVADAHARGLERLGAARGVILAIPSDTGAGFVRGANMGPQALRGALWEGDPAWGERLQEAGVVDLGDVLAVPQLLHDGMLNEDQLAASRAAVYPDCGEVERAGLPVAPLSVAERVLDLVLAERPDLKVFVLGGDHSVAWPAVAALARARPPDRVRWGIVQMDAHTDLLAERLGVRYCFATWSYHANRLLGGAGRLVQAGIRASGKPRAYWEEALGVRQYWADAVRANPETEMAGLCAHLRSGGIGPVYFSNDIDGTSAEFAPATGTPEPGGLEPGWVIELIRRLGKEPGIMGGDIVEVAPPLSLSEEGSRKTVALAARYFRELLAAAMGEAEWVAG